MRPMSRREESTRALGVLGWHAALVGVVTVVQLTLSRESIATCWLLGGSAVAEQRIGSEQQHGVPRCEPEWGVSIRRELNATCAASQKSKLSNKQTNEDSRASSNSLDASCCLQVKPARAHVRLPILSDAKLYVGHCRSRWLEK
jgi:hypothetical protein